MPRGFCRGAALIAGGFALAALLLALAGVHGVLAHLVARRRREIGLRLAIGAAPSRVRSHVLREGLWLSGAGLVLAAAALACWRPAARAAALDPGEALRDE